MSAENSYAAARGQETSLLRPLFYIAMSLTRVRFYAYCVLDIAYGSLEREKTRKMYVASLFARTPEQIAEEEGLYIEIKRLEQTERRFAKEREELMKTVAGIESGLNVHQPDEEAFSGLFIDPRRKKRKGDGMDVDSPTSAGPSSSPARRAISAKQAAEGGHLGTPA